MLKYPPSFIFTRIYNDIFYKKKKFWNCIMKSRKHSRIEVLYIVLQLKYGQSKRASPPPLPEEKVIFVAWNKVKELLISIRKWIDCPMSIINDMMVSFNFYPEYEMILPLMINRIFCTISEFKKANNAAITVEPGMS